MNEHIEAKWNPTTDIKFVLVILVYSLLHTSCKQEIVPPEYRPSNAHEAYGLALSKLGMAEFELGKQWLHASIEAIMQPMSIDLPYTEAFHINPEKVMARGYQFDARKGQKVLIQLNQLDNSPINMFGDLFRIDNDSLRRWSHVASIDTSQQYLGIEINQDARYCLRLQSELLAGGNFECAMTIGPSLEFPVLGGNKRDIGSFFGDPRDGGRRKHHGIDIFAKRHTPIISPVDGQVRFAGEKGLGGRVVWLRDAKHRQTLYFAHLHDILVETNDRIVKGDTLGTVGNTGNARTTPPHLHFGIYQNGPIDPYPYVASINRKIRSIQGDKSLLGQDIRLNQSVTMEGKSLQRHQVFQVLALQGQRFQLLGPEGSEIWVNNSIVEDLDKPIKVESANAALAISSTPSVNQIPESYTAPEDELQYLGRNGQFWYIGLSDGQKGWISADVAP